MTRRMVTGLLAVPLAVAVATPVATATADDETAGCPDVEVVFARGTGEPVGLGLVGQAFADALSTRLSGRTVTSYPVNYPASYNFFTAAVGADDAAAHIADISLRCPSTEIVLGGFSQGAAVVSMLSGVRPLGDTVGDLGSAPPLPPASAEHVTAVAVFGNPSSRFGLPLSSAGSFAGRAIDICAAGDPVCSLGDDRSAHSSYVANGLTGPAVEFVAGLA